MVKRTDDGDAMGIMIAANENRQDDSPVIRARKAQRYIDLGRSEEDVAITFGIPLTSVKGLLSLLDLDDQVQVLIHERRLSQTAALTLRDLPREQQREKAEEYATLGVTVEEAKRQTKMRKTNGNGHGEDARGVRPSMAVLRKLSESEDFIGGLSFQEVLNQTQPSLTQIAQQSISTVTDQFGRVGLTPPPFVAD